MFWHKSWLDTRWRFFTGLALLMCSAAGIVLFYPRAMALLRLVPSGDVGGGIIGQRIREAAEMMRSFDGYIFDQWFRQTPIEMGTLFAILLGSGSLLSQGLGGAVMFTLSMPASRQQLVGARAATGLVEWSVLAFVPSLLIPLLSPSVGASYGVGNALVHGLCLFAAGSVFFSLALFLSTIFDDLWRPLLLALMAAVGVGLCETASSTLARVGPFSLMSGEGYFRTGAIPWVGLFVSTAMTGAILFAAAQSFAKREF